MATKETFAQFLNHSNASGGFRTEDVIAVMVPFFEEIQALHEDGKVVDWFNQDAVYAEDGRLYLSDNAGISPVLALDRVEKIQAKTKSGAFEISGTYRQITETGGNALVESSDLLLWNEKMGEIKQPVFLVGYASWETKIGHHDQHTDLFHAGILLAALALHFDPAKEDEMSSFVGNRERLIFLNHQVHPVIANLITELCEPNRHKRARDLEEVIQKLKNYRDFNPEKNIDLAEFAKYRKKEDAKEVFLLRKLRGRLFDISRRNKLLYFQSNMRFLNLSVSSVPHVLNIRNINPENLFIWNKEIAAKVKAGEDLLLNKYLSFSDYPYVQPTLDKIRVEANKDVQEYGFSQLRLVLCFLNWYNTKEAANERIVSPFILMPVKLVKRKALKDQYVLEFSDTEAEINPVLLYQLRELYNIQLPETVNLSATSLEQLYEVLRLQIEQSGSGITLDAILKPRINLIQAVARQTVNQYNRRLRKRNRSLQSYQAHEYSYESGQFTPLGLQLYREHIEPKASYLEFLVNEDIRMEGFSDQVVSEKERELYSLDSGKHNPFRWEFDTCNMTIGNFNYKKMSLVRDYNRIIDENKTNAVFEELFADQPKSISQNKNSSRKFTEQFQIIPADPTQKAAVFMASEGKSYIIQGPPGTGKSQTITNLIADLVAKGKKILFVCEKRAALDVVYYRLKKQGLDELCCLIHDSQEDKKAFIQDLKKIYQKNLTAKPDVAAVQLKRNQLIASMNRALSQLEDYHKAMNEIPSEMGMALRELIERLNALKTQGITLTEEKIKEDVPGYIQWKMYGEKLQHLSQRLLEIGAAPEFSKHPLAQLHKRFYVDNSLHGELQRLIDESESLIAEALRELDRMEVPEQFKTDFPRLSRLTGLAYELKEIATQDNLGLLTGDAGLQKQLDGVIGEMKKLDKKIRKMFSETRHWKHKFSETEIQAAMDKLNAYESNFFRFLMPGWYGLKKQMHAAYDFQAHSIKPGYRQVLQQLFEEHQLLKQKEELLEDCEQQFHCEDPQALKDKIEKIRNAAPIDELEFISNTAQPKTTVQQLERLREMVDRSEIKLAALLNGFRDISLADLEELLEDLRSSAAQLPDLFPVLEVLKDAPDQLWQVLRKQSLSLTELEMAMGQKSLRDFYRLNKHIQQLEGSILLFLTQQLKKDYETLLDLNAAFIRESAKQQFLDLIRLSEQSAAGMSKEAKEHKRAITEGRKILENEFAKSIRYKSIRDLASAESGELIRTMKPVWLMSPLSVSDTLPIEQNTFDIVIFDEASQITLEEGIPPLFRAGQSIIVGDEMQMPPTNFFSSGVSNQEDIWEEEEEFISIDADSLLTQGARKLPSVLLGWHYRSRYEALISFSNAAFYERELLTIPDRTDFPKESPAIVIQQREQAKDHLSALGDRPVSYHFMQHGLYEHRTNIAEAEYIAEMVIQLLLKDVPESIGIVAFSQEQQNEIEDALERRVLGDAALAGLLEKAYERTEDDQFVGLFVKNLENVQGDERDIMIMSVCYGYDARKKMLMNFGPINRKGGEKRLNVIFSRARKHMAIVASIKYTDIRNEYNEGANYLRKYLHYAELISTGFTSEAMQVLDSMSLQKNASHISDSSSITRDIQERLENKGWYVQSGLGQSHFKVTLGVKHHKDDSEFALGILLDDALHYADPDIEGNYFQRPEILRTFGWKVTQVFCKDWLEQPEKVLLRIEKLLSGHSPEEDTPAIEE